MREFERLSLQDELLVGDHRDLGPGGDAIALLDGERCDRAADPRPGGELMDRLDRRHDRLLVGDARGVDDEGPGDRRQGRRQDGGEQKGKAHGWGPRKALETYIHIF